MKDYSTQQGKYAIIEHDGIYAIIRPRIRVGDEVDDRYYDTLSISKSKSVLQRQLDDWYERESTPLASGMERWKQATAKQKKLKEKIEAKS